MSTVDDELFAARLGDALDVEDRRDWLDVQRRARAGRRRRLSRPGGLLVAALVVAGGGSLALGLGAKVLDRDVPANVRAAFQRNAPPAPLDGAPPWQRLFRIGKIVKGTEHRVVSLRTPRGLVSLYVARTSHGGYCDLTFGGGSGGGGCNDRGRTYASTPIDLSTQRSADYLLFSGRAGQRGAYAVAVRFRGRPARRIVLTGGWFLYDVPRGSWASGSHPVTAIDVLDRDGRRLASMPDPLRLQAREPPFSDPVPSTVRLLSAQALPNGGGTVTLWTGRDAQGHRCFRHLRNGVSQQAPDWECTPGTNRWSLRPPSTAHPQGGVRVPVRWDLGVRSSATKSASYGWIYAYGWAAPPVVSLRLRFQDGRQLALPLHDGDFLYVVPPASWVDGHRPSILVGYDARGRQLYRQFLYPRQHCLYPGLDPPCGDVQVATG